MAVAVTVAILSLATVYSAIVSFRADGSGGRRWLFPERAGRRLRNIVVAVSFVALAGLAVWAGMSMRQASRAPSRYLLPDGYTGWARVEYDVPGAAALPWQDGHFLLKFGPDARLQTSSREQFGWAKDEFFYVRGNELRPLRQTGTGGGGEIWGRINGEARARTGRRQYEEFFVGTEQQFRRAVDLKEAPAPKP